MALIDVGCFWLVIEIDYVGWCWLTVSVVCRLVLIGVRSVLVGTDRCGALVLDNVGRW